MLLGSGTMYIFKQIFTEQKFNSIPNPCDLVVDMLLDILGGLDCLLHFHQHHRRSNCHCALWGTGKLLEATSCSVRLFDNGSCHEPSNWL
jgi:hypothetical protein